jgi:integrase
VASIRTLNTGNWQAQVRRAGHPPITRSFARRDMAAQWSREIEREIDRGTYMDRSAAEHTVVSDLIDRYLAEVTPRKKSAAKEVRRLAALRRHFGMYSALRIQPKHIASYRDGRLTEGTAGATVIKDLNSLSHVFDVAMRDWGLPLIMNPLKQVRRPAVNKGRERRLKPGEEQKLLDACGASRATLLAPLVVLALETAMRLGELLSLTWDTIDLNARVAELHDTKNGECRRVPLSSRAVETLKTMPRAIHDQRVFWSGSGVRSRPI